MRAIALAILLLAMTLERKGESPPLWFVGLVLLGFLGCVVLGL